MIKIDNSHFYDMEPVVDLEHFIELLLVTFAERYDLLNTTLIKSSERIAKLPTNFKESIQEAMYDETSYILRFLQLIDSNKYYEKQSVWEEELADAFNEYLTKNNKKAKYNFYSDTIDIIYTKEEIDKILEKYDSDIRNTMKYFVLYFDEPISECNRELKQKEFDREIIRKFGK